MRSDTLAYIVGMVRALAATVSIFIAPILGALGMLATFMPSRVTALDAWVNAHPQRARTALGIFFLVVSWASWEQYSAGQQSEKQISTLIAGNQATANDIHDLRQEMHEGFDRVVAAISGSTPLPAPSVPPEPCPAPSAGALPAPCPQPSPSPQVRHLRFTQKRVVSDLPALPFSLQVVVQTDTATQPTTLAIHFDGPVNDGRFFVTGQFTMMNVAMIFTEDRKTFIMKFAFPAWTPASPIVATVFSQQDVNAIGVSGGVDGE